MPWGFCPLGFRPVFISSIGAMRAVSLLCIIFNSNLRGFIPTFVEYQHWRGILLVMVLNASLSNQTCTHNVHHFILFFHWCIVGSWYPNVCNFYRTLETSSTNFLDQLGAVVLVLKKKSWFFSFFMSFANFTVSEKNEGIFKFYRKRVLIWSKNISSSIMFSQHHERIQIF